MVSKGEEHRGIQGEWHHMVSKGEWHHGEGLSAPMLDVHG